MCPPAPETGLDSAPGPVRVTAPGRGSLRGRNPLRGRRSARGCAGAPGWHGPSGSGDTGRPGRARSTRQSTAITRRGCPDRLGDRALPRSADASSVTPLFANRYSSASCWPTGYGGRREASKKANLQDSQKGPGAPITISIPSPVSLNLAPQRHFLGGVSFNLAHHGHSLGRPAAPRDSELPQGAVGSSG
jgi:hypothetical protein